MIVSIGLFRRQGPCAHRPDKPVACAGRRVGPAPGAGLPSRAFRHCTASSERGVADAPMSRACTGIVWGLFLAGVYQWNRKRKAERNQRVRARHRIAWKAGGEGPAGEAASSMRGRCRAARRGDGSRAASRAASKGGSAMPRHGLQPAAVQLRICPGLLGSQSWGTACPRGSDPDRALPCRVLQLAMVPGTKGIMELLHHFPTWIRFRETEKVEVRLLPVPWACCARVWQRGGTGCGAAFPQTSESA